MNEALPTPYDIVGLPAYAWQPGALAWTALALLAAVPVAATFFSRRKKSLINAWKLGIAELENVGANKDSDITKLSLASSITKRMCGYLEQGDFSGMSPGELEAYATKSQGYLGQILTKLASIDRARYSAIQQMPEALPAIIELRQLLGAFWLSKQPKEKQ